jgi:hypothetical protein
VAAVSGTFNMIDPVRERRDAGMRRLDQLAGACALLGTGIITLCTGTRDPDDMWRDVADGVQVGVAGLADGVQVRGLGDLPLAEQANAQPSILFPHDLALLLETHVLQTQGRLV